MLEDLFGNHSLLYSFFLLILLIAVFQGIAVGSLYFLKRSGGRKANFFYGFLLISFALTLLHNIFLFTAFYERFPQFTFFPLYFTLAFPTLLFYHVKFSLYPNYRFRWTDLKHFILPVGQFIFFVAIFLSTLEVRNNMYRHFYNPFYGGIEQAIYLTTFFAYLYFAFRYVRQKQRTVRNRKEQKKAAYLSNLLKILFILFAIHAMFIVGDFISYEFLDVNLKSLKPYAALGALSFAALLFWLSLYGFQVLIWGRKLFYT